MIIVFISRQGFYGDGGSFEGGNMLPPQMASGSNGPGNFVSNAPGSFGSGGARFHTPGCSRPGLLPLPPPSQMINPPMGGEPSSPGMDDNENRCKSAVVVRNRFRMTTVR